MVVNVIKPNAPIWMRQSITIRPKMLHVWKVSTTTSPVTDVAEVAVNNAVRKFISTPFLWDTGNISKIAPTKITPKYPSNITFAGFNRLRCCPAPTDCIRFIKMSSLLLDISVANKKAENSPWKVLRS